MKANPFFQPPTDFTAEHTGCGDESHFLKDDVSITVDGDEVFHASDMEGDPAFHKPTQQLHAQLPASTLVLYAIAH